MLERLVRAAPSLHEDAQLLRSFTFDVPEPLVYLTRQHAIDVLERHARGAISDDDLVVWADVLEVRDDVQPEPEFHHVLNELLFELSEPPMTGKALPALAAEWRDRLSQL